MFKQRYFLLFLLTVILLMGCGEMPASSPPATPTFTGLILNIPTASATNPTPVVEALPNPEATLSPDQLPPFAFTRQDSFAGLTFNHQTLLGRKEDGSKMMGGGVTGDFNNDGWQDIFLLGGGLQPDALFFNNGDSTFRNVTESAGLSSLHVGSGAIVGDYNNDGWLDIFVTSFGTVENMAPGQHRLYHNNGDGTFTDKAVDAGVNQTSPVLADGFGSTFGDYDLDGDLDLFVTGWRIFPELGKGNRLFQNNGDGTFTDVTDSAGFVDEGIRGFSPCFADMDGDRYPELLLVADFGTSLYYVNNTDGTFQEYSDLAGTGQEWSGMGLATGDFNNDGLLDWYATAIFGRDGDGRGTGNKLYLNRGNHQYAEIAANAGVDDGGWGWGAMGVDLNQDGWLDLVETNGWSDIPSYDNEMTHIWLANGDFTFTDVAENAGIQHTTDGLGVFHLDYDADGDQDLGITTLNGAFHFYRNELTLPNSNWVRVILDTQNAPQLAPNGIGSRVWVKSGGQEQVRDLLACPHYLSQSETTAHFGVGEQTNIRELVVQWTDGTETIIRDVPVNQTITIAP